MTDIPTQPDSSTRDEEATVAAETRGEGMALRAMLGGSLMGLANLVPGISGGTMLLATGVYPQFVNGVAEVSTFRFRRRSVLILACIIGAAFLAVVTLAGVVKDLVVDYRWVMYALFIGLTLGGVPVLWRMLRPADGIVVLMSIIGIALMAVLAFIGPAQAAVDTDSHAYAMYFVAGLAGAVAMVLPGVSGGYLLLVLGQYVTLLAAIDQMRSGASSRDWSLVTDAMHVIVPVGLGVLVGVVGVSNLVKMLLERCERPTLGFLLGLLLGAVLGLWPFQRGVPPVVGSTFKGDSVIERDGVLIMETTGKLIEAADYQLAVFTPAWWQIAAALGLIVAGFAISVGIASLGRGPGEQRAD